ncbi:hypothetical protein QYF61_024445 [Mycteria americana]|uniref:tRNA pseudouridine(55) synthase n=1 Tax=Mycteria americana TaxID=33587 RepID=A0AAN7P335_MYCAM|nr:hypothetical protein QYF61_024445 [Mycteria americana]
MAAREAGGVVLSKSADKLFSLSGLFAVYKPKGPTSAGVLNLLKERLLAAMAWPRLGNGVVPGYVLARCVELLGPCKTQRVGHAARPDSLISLLPSQKYTAIGLLGKATDTLDATGKVTEEKPYDQITKGDLENVLQKFTGEIMQVPPL